MKSTRKLGISIVAELMRGRTTVGDLAAKTDSDPKTARLWVQDLQAAGLVRPRGSVRVSRTGNQAILWEWNEGRTGPLSVGAAPAASAGLADGSARDRVQDPDRGP